jgi:ABC-type multidrug transport system permease subunit
LKVFVLPANLAMILIMAKCFIPMQGIWDNRMATGRREGAFHFLKCPPSSYTCSISVPPNTL